MLIDSYSEAKQFFADIPIDVITEANLWMKENNIIATNLTLTSYMLPRDADNQLRWYIIVTYNVKEPLNAVGEAARERMPKDIPYVPKGRIEGTRHH